MRVDIWSDIVCPWCYIGKRRFERGLAGFDRADEVEVVYHAFELDPAFPAGPGTPVQDLLASKYGLGPEQARQAEESVAAQAAAEGLPFSTARLMGNTFDAHRLVRLGQASGRQAEMLQRLYEAYFAEARPVFEADELVAQAEAAGVDPDRARAMLAGDSFADEVREDEDTARSIGISGVPFVVLDGRLGVSGAQSAQTFTMALEQAWPARA